MAAPLVSVIIPTYNYSAALRCAVSSVLAQRFTDYEVLVIGDGCTDDSAAVVASFGDARIRWHNLAENSGYQATPNNAGLAMARGNYIAYLGHDDLWLPEHLSRMVAKIEATGADVVYSVGVMIVSRDHPIRVLVGATPANDYDPGVLLVPSVAMHRREMASEIGGWRDYREHHAPADQAFFAAAWTAGKRFSQLRELTVLKFPSAWRKDVYRQGTAPEQEAYLARLNDPGLRIAELTAVALAYAEGNARSPVDFAPAPVGAEAGWMVEQWREWKGLPRGSGARTSLPLYRDPGALCSLNRRTDIVPADSLQALFSAGALPENGVLLGRGWHDLEQDGEERFRWLTDAGEVMITRPSTGRRRMVVEAESGPGMRCRPFEITLADEQGTPIRTATVSYRRPIPLELPSISAEGAVFRLTAPPGGVQAGADPRVLNLRVFSIRSEAI